MSGMYGYSREAVRIKVRKVEGSAPPEYRKFSVDPQITSFEVLQSLLDKAFEIKGDFTICYRVSADGTTVTQSEYMPLLSDLDLEAAFLKADNASITNNTESCLCLRVEVKPFEECTEEWDQKNRYSIMTQIRQTCEPKAPRLHGIFNQMGKTLNMMQRSLNFGEDNTTVPLQPPRAPLSDSEFRQLLDPVGHIKNHKELRTIIYFGGIEPSLRRVIWKHILNVYPEGMNGHERMEYIRRKTDEYVALRRVWKDAITQGAVVGELGYTTSMVRKDVLRTDRHHPFYAGSDDNQNIASLFNILTTYALNHPKVSYCQGMSDLASPLLVTLDNEAQAYICFCALMSRLCSNFMMDGIAMTQKFTHLTESLMYYDPEFYNYLKQHQADDLLFCYRWLLLEMKREFAFDDSLRMLEVLWSSLPFDPPTHELKLFDVLFQAPRPIAPSMASPPPASPLVKTHRENPYTKVCALRRQTSSVSLCSFTASKPKVIAGGCGTRKIKRQNHSLDETVSSNSGFSQHISHEKHQSFDDTDIYTVRNGNVLHSGDNVNVSSRLMSPNKEMLRPRSVSPVEANSDSVLLNNRRNRELQTTVTAAKVKGSGLSSSMSNLLKNNKNNVTASKKGGHFQALKDRITASGGTIFSSLDLLDSNRTNCANTNQTTYQEENQDPVGGAPIHRPPRTRLVKNFNEFMMLGAVRNKISDKMGPLLTHINSADANSNNSDVKRPPMTGDCGSPHKPKIMLTRSSLDESESSSVDPRSTATSADASCDMRSKRHCSSTSTNSYDDTFDDYSPDDSQEYFPMTTSVTRELKIEMENLDRQVFGSRYTDRLLESDSHSSDCTEEGTRSSGAPEVNKTHTKSPNVTKCEVGDDFEMPKLPHIHIVNKPTIEEGVFLWENPLPEPPSPSNGLGKLFCDGTAETTVFVRTPDEQADLDFDGCEQVGQIVDEKTKTVTPIKVINSTTPSSTLKRQNGNTNLMTRSLAPTSSSNCHSIPPGKSGVLDVMSASCTQLDTLKLEQSAEATETSATYINGGSSCRQRSPSRASGSGAQLPPPTEFGGGNPFLMFLCVAVLLQHRDQIIGTAMDYNEMAMHFDKMVRKHNVTRVLNHARQLHGRYMKQQVLLQEDTSSRAPAKHVGNC